MGRSILSVFAGMVSWSVLWISTNAVLAALFPDIIVPEQYVGHLGMLLTFLIASVAYSIAAGYVTGMVATRDHLKHGLALGIAQLAIGISFQSMYWDLMPVWYHLTFLVLLIPGNLAGAALRARP